MVEEYMTERMRIRADSIWPWYASRHPGVDELLKR